MESSRRGEKLHHPGKTVHNGNRLVLTASTLFIVALLVALYNLHGNSFSNLSLFILYGISITAPLLLMATILLKKEDLSLPTNSSLDQDTLSRAQSIAHFGSWEWQISNGTLKWSDETFRIFGLDPGGISPSYTDFLLRIHPDDRDNVADALYLALTGAKPYQIEHRIIRPSGEERIILEQGEIFRNEEGYPQRVMGVIHDVTEAKHTENELKLSASVFHHATESIVIMDTNCKILRANKAFVTMTGITPSDAIGKRPQDVYICDQLNNGLVEDIYSTLASKGEWQGEIKGRRHDKSTLLTWHHISAIRNDFNQTIQYVDIFSDVTERKQAEEKIRQLAQFDQVTQLPNRHLFYDRLTHSLTRAQRQGLKVGVLFVDLDRFKNINDTLGHQAGDLLLKKVAGRLMSCVRQQDTIARIGGDEFTLILEDIHSPNDAVLVANKLAESLVQKIDLGGYEASIGASIGISVFPLHGHDADTILKNADTAMYQAKSRGRNQHAVYDIHLDHIASKRINDEARLRTGFQNKELLLHYQPQVDLTSGRVVAAEALLRWQHPELGLLYPTNFITTAEESGLIGSIDHWVITQACNQAKEWEKEGTPLRVSINLSSHYLSQPDVVEKVEQAITRADILPGHLEIELTEHQMLNYGDGFAHLMSELKSLGISLALDNFGTGFSSLAYLSHRPFERLKIDISVIQGAQHNTHNQTLATAITAMAERFGMRVTAEGVEDKEQLAFLNQIHCDEAQGYYFSAPIEVAEFRHLYLEHS